MSVITKTDIPLVDLKAQYRTIREEVRTAIDDVLDGMQLTLGPRDLRQTHSEQVT